MIVKQISSLLLLLSCYACNDIKSTESRNAEKNIPLENDGVSINYTDSKAGDTVLLFIHGWGINQTYWENQVEFFSEKYRVVTIDLPGFGLSGKNRSNWTVENYGRDIAVLVEKLNLENVVLVGHSMSGAIMVETAIQNPKKIIALVGVDNLNGVGTSITPEQEKEVAEFFNDARKHFTEIMSAYIDESLFAPSTDSSIRQRVKNDILHSDSAIAIDCLEQNFHYPLDKKLISLKTPLYLINSERTPTDTLSFQKNNIECKLYNAGATGHYPMLENANRFNLLLQQAINSIRK